MSRQYIEAQHVLARYLAGQLSDAEREAFETYYVEHPQVLQELEVAAKLKLGLTLLADSGELAAPARRYWLSGLAAAVLLAVIAAAFWFARPTPAAPVLAATVSALGEFHTAPLLADTYTIERTRSRSFDARFELPPMARIIGLRVLPERQPATGYELQLNVIAGGGAAREIAHLRSLQADADGLVTVYADSGRLQPGSYEIILSADSDSSAASEAASSFLIRVEPANRNK